jgi:hypothetical protein
MAKAGRFSDSPENRKRCSGGLGRSSKHHTTTDRGTPTAAGAPVLAENRGAAGPDRRRERPSTWAPRRARSVHSSTRQSRQHRAVHGVVVPSHARRAESINRISSVRRARSARLSGSDGELPRRWS